MRLRRSPPAGIGAWACSSKPQRDKRVWRDILEPADRATLGGALARMAAQFRRAQSLADLAWKLVAGTLAKVGLAGYGLEVVEYVEP